jgi:chemotaxis protein histidine kinase CheA
VRARRLTLLARRLVGVLATQRAALAELERGDFLAALPSGSRTRIEQERARGEARRPLIELVAGLSPLCAGLAQEAAASEALLGELDAQVRSLRLVPIAQLLERYVRAIRDLAREHGKEAIAEVRDAGVHLDKALLDRLAGPLTHLIRNAIDHGLEDPEERAAAGKPRAGRVSLAAEPRAGMVALTIADDGRGIDPERVRARAVELGLIGDEESRALAKPDILQLLFLPGVSTRRTVTETSGRGIGLDAVKREIEHMGGHVRIAAERGRGTTLELQLPVSVALTRVLVIRLGDLRFGMPSAAISAVLSARADDLEEVHHRRAVRVGDERLSLVDLGALMGRPAALADPVQAIVIGDGGRRLALTVSGWEDDQDVVVKPLGELLESVRLFSGACVLESGALTLVLNPATVMAQALEAARGAARRPEPSQ